MLIHTSMNAAEYDVPLTKTHWLCVKNIEQNASVREVSSKPKGTVKDLPLHKTGQDRTLSQVFSAEKVYSEFSTFEKKKHNKGVKVELQAVLKYSNCIHKKLFLVHSKWTADRYAEVGCTGTR